MLREGCNCSPLEESSQNIYWVLQKWSHFFDCTLGISINYESIFISTIGNTPTFAFKLEIFHPPFIWIIPTEVYDQLPLHTCDDRSLASRFVIVWIVHYQWKINEQHIYRMQPQSLLLSTDNSTSWIFTWDAVWMYVQKYIWASGQKFTTIQSTHLESSALSKTLFLLLSLLQQMFHCSGSDSFDAQF